MTLARIILAAYAFYWGLCTPVFAHENGAHHCHIDSNYTHRCH